MNCGEIMKTEVRCLDQSSTVEEAARLMREANVGFLPVCDAEKHVMGTLTDRDIAIRVVADGRSPLETKAKDVMTSDVVAARPEDDLAIAEKLMADHRKSRVMILDGDDRVVGVISLSDIAEHESLRRTAATLREVAARETRA